MNESVEKFVEDLMDNDKGCHCPNCGRFAKVYRRKLNSTTAKQLISLYRSGGGEEFIHSKNFVVGTGVGDLTKAKYFGLLESAHNEDETKKTSGLWRLTDEGIDFVLGRKFVLIYNDTVQGFSQEQVSIEQSLGSEFDYQQLMRG